MKRSEAILKISENLQKHENMFRGYAKGSIDIKCTCDNLATYLIKELENMGMLPPGYMKPIPFEEDGKQYPLIPGDVKYNGVWYTPGVNEWEPEE